MKGLSENPYIKYLVELNLRHNRCVQCKDDKGACGRFLLRWLRRRKAMITKKNNPLVRRMLNVEQNVSIQRPMQHFDTPV